MPAPLPRATQPAASSTDGDRKRTNNEELAALYRRLSQAEQKAAADLAAQRKQHALELTAAVSEANEQHSAKVAAKYSKWQKSTKAQVTQKESAATRKEKEISEAKLVAMREDAAAKLKQAVEQASQRAEQAVHDSLREEAAKAAAARSRVCCICQDSILEENGISCALKHFTCTDCLVGCIKVRVAQSAHSSVNVLYRNK